MAAARTPPHETEKPDSEIARSLQTSRAFLALLCENIRKFKKVALPADYFGSADLCGSRLASCEQVVVVWTAMQNAFRASVVTRRDSVQAPYSCIANRDQ